MLMKSSFFFKKTTQGFKKKGHQPHGGCVCLIYAAYMCTSLVIAVFLNKLFKLKNT